MKKILFTAAVVSALPLFAFANSKIEEGFAYNYQNKRNQFADTQTDSTMPSSSKEMDRDMNKDMMNKDMNSMKMDKMEMKSSQEDKDLLSKVQIQIKSGKFGNTSKIQVRVENKVVYLDGTADSKEVIDSLEESILDILGVKTVINNLKVSNANGQSNGNKMNQPMQPQKMESPQSNNQQNRYNSSNRVSMNDKAEKAEVKGEDALQNKMDKQLRDQVHNELNNNWFSKNYPEIDVQVSNGIVFLHGMVDSPKDKNDIQNRIKGLKGVKRIENNITVKENKSPKG